MSIFSEVKQTLSCLVARVIRTDSFRVIVIAALAPLQFLPIQALAQSVLLPQVDVVSRPGPACASSANGTGHIICLATNLRGDFTAFSLLTQNGTFASPALDPPANTNSANGPLNPLRAFGSGGGALSPASCASTADGSGDIVCAYAAPDNLNELIGVRFNIFSGLVYSQQILVSNLTVSGISCTNGDQRFTVTGPPTQETPAGATICAFVSSGHAFLNVVAFNPATGYSKVVSSITSNVAGPPSCTNANDGSNVTICAFGVQGAAELKGIAIDPRTAFVSSIQTLYSGTSFGGSPGCATADGTGKVICAVSGTNSTLLGFAFDPRTGFTSPLRSLGTVAAGLPSCSGIADGSNEVICAITSGTNAVSSIKFDPRTGASSGLLSSSVTSAAPLSCTFQNINAAQISCVGVAPGPEQYFGLILAQ